MKLFSVSAWDRRCARAMHDWEDEPSCVDDVLAIPSASEPRSLPVAFAVWDIDRLIGRFTFRTSAVSVVSASVEESFHIGLYVIPSYCSKGFGFDILQRCIARLSTLHSVGLLTASIALCNTRSVKLFHRFGFRLVSTDWRCTSLKSYEDLLLLPAYYFIDLSSVIITQVPVCVQYGLWSFRPSVLDMPGALAARSCLVSG